MKSKDIEETANELFPYIEGDDWTYAKQEGFVEGAKYMYKQLTGKELN